jgi:hypothetical protein
MPAQLEGAGDSELCEQSIARYERTHAIPLYLLSAIALAESGRKGPDGLQPWPWTVHAEGQGYYFGSRAQAVDAVQQLQARGITNIDVGCMQVNLGYHAKAFRHLEDAFDPEHNVAFASAYLKQQFARHGRWRSAVADYHSRTPSLGDAYANRVMQHWYKRMAKGIEQQHRVAQAIPQTVEQQQSLAYAGGAAFHVANPAPQAEAAPAYDPVFAQDSGQEEIAAYLQAMKIARLTEAGMPEPQPAVPTRAPVPPADAPAPAGVAQPVPPGLDSPPKMEGVWHIAPAVAMVPPPVAAPAPQPTDVAAAPDKPSDIPQAAAPIPEAEPSMEVPPPQPMPSQRLGMLAFEPDVQVIFSY